MERRPSLILRMAAYGVCAGLALDPTARGPSMRSGWDHALGAPPQPPRPAAPRRARTRAFVEGRMGSSYSMIWLLSA